VRFLVLTPCGLIGRFRRNILISVFSPSPLGRWRLPTGLQHDFITQNIITVHLVQENEYKNVRIPNGSVAVP
jgi:hypothetical protein